MRQNSRISGYMVAYGTRRSRAHRGMSGRFNTSSMALPVYMLVMIPQKTSGACLTRSGPGGSPWVISAPRRIAMTALAGMPRVSSGMNAPPAAGLTKATRAGY